MPSPSPTFEAIVIGAGIAGAAIVKSLKNNNINNFLVLDRGLGGATQTSAHSEALCHPYIGRGASRLQRLTFLAFYEAKKVWASSWHGKGVFHLPRTQEGFSKELMGARLLEQGFGLANACPLSKEEALEQFNVNAGGTYFPEGGWVNIQKACHEVFDQLLPSQKRWSTEVCEIKFENEHWYLRDSRSELIAVSKRLFLANGLDAQRLCEQIQVELPLKPVRGQLSRFRFDQSSAWLAHIPKVALSGKAYCLPPSQVETNKYEWVIGSTYDEGVHDLTEWDESHIENSELMKGMLGLQFLEEGLKPHSAFVGIRCVASDRLPIIGPVKGHQGLYTLISLGSRGVMWSALASQMFTEHLAHEMAHSAFLDDRFFAGARLVAAGLTADLAGAFGAARFLAGASNSKLIFPSG
jgi:tRNA 5-methylaminomethyl-2-thiouridine biosynthesis bifunctional protein